MLWNDIKLIRINYGYHSFESLGILNQVLSLGTMNHVLEIICIIINSDLESITSSLTF